MTDMAGYQAIPALSAGGAWILSEMCPALYWAQSPLNPAPLARKNRAEFDIGTAAHLAMLEPLEYGSRVLHVPFETYHKAEAREIRDAAYAEGKTPLKPSEVATVDGVREAVQKRPDVARLFTGGAAEVTHLFEMDGVRCKARPDYLSNDLILDLKTVSSAHPRAAGMAAMRDGWHLRAPWYREAVRAAAGPGERPYLFVCVEKQPPHLIEVYQLDARAIAWGEQIMRRALTLFKRCMAAGEWPGYCGEIPVTLPLPTWAEYQLADREQAGEFAEAASAATLARGREWLAP